MEEEKKLNFVRNGVAKLPPGFRFEPTDEEIVFQYLKCKVFGLPLPAAVIPEINVCEYDPWDLPGEEEKDMYFFCNKKMNVSSRATCSGYWKSTGEERLILSSTSADNRLIGLRKTVVFYKGNISSVGNKDGPIITDWNMHEYQMIVLASSSSADCKSHPSPKKQWLTLSFKGGWSICHIVKNKNKPDVISHASSMTLSKRIREDTDIDYSSNEGFKLSRLEYGANTSSSSSSSASSSCSSWSSSVSELSSSDTEETSSSSSSCLQ